MFVSGMLPVFVTVPLYVTTPPGATGESGHICVTAIPGVVVIVQVVVTALVMLPPQRLCPVTVAVLVVVQLVGAR